MFWDRKKIITLTLLAALGVFAYITSVGKGTTQVLDIAPEHFAIKDTLAIRTIVLSQGSRRVELSSKTGAWQVNGRHRASELNIQRLLYIIKNVRAKRSLTTASAQATIDKLKKDGVTIQVLGQDKPLLEFIADDGELTSSSCFYDPKSQKAYFVELPAYTDDFSHFFKVDANVWRSRLIASNSIKNLETLTSNFNGKVVRFTYKDAFFEIPNVKNIDSNTVGMYLIQFRNLECDAFVADSLQHLCPKDFKKAFGSVTIKDIDPTQSNTLYFFEIPSHKRQFLGYSTKLNECFWLAKNKTLDLLIETEKLFEKQQQ